MLVINCCLERNSQYLKFNLNRIPFQLILLLLQNPKCIFNFLSTIISSKDSLLLDFTRFTFLGITRFFLKYPKIVSYIYKIYQTKPCPANERQNHNVV